MNIQSIKITFFFTAEILLFVLTGILIALGIYVYALITLFFSVLVAGYVGRLIGDQAVEEYKENE